MSSEYPSTPQYQPPPTPGWSGPTLAGQENFGLAVAASIGVAALGVVAWVILAEAVQVQTAIVGFGVALGSAAAFRRFAPRNPAAPVTIVAVTVISALVGLLASQYSLLAQGLNIGFFDTVKLVPLSRVPRLMTTGTNALTWIIVALSGYSGYRASLQFRAQQQRAAGPPPQNYVAPAPPVAPPTDPTI